MSSFFDAVDAFFIGHAITAFVLHSLLSFGYTLACQNINKREGVAFELLCVIYCFFALAIVCDEYLAPALETLCLHWEVREDVAGATFLAFGSAAPEIVINSVTTLKSQLTSSNSVSLGISAIIGSGMLAFSFIPAMCCFASDIELKLKRRPLIRDESFYLIALCALCVAFHDGQIDLFESILLLCIWFAHLLTVVSSPWIRRKYRQKVKGIVAEQRSFVHKARAELQHIRQRRRSKGSSDLQRNEDDDASLLELLHSNPDISMEEEVGSNYVELPGSRMSTNPCAQDAYSLRRIL